MSLPNSKHNLPGLSALWFMSLAMVLGVFLLTAVPLILSAATLNSTAWIGFAGSVVGGAVAIGGLAVATQNVRRQVRVGLLSREEERMEAALPGLKEIAGYTQDFRKLLGGSFAAHSLVNKIAAHNNVRAGGGPLVINLEKLIPSADKHLRQRLLIIMQDAWLHAHAVLAAEDNFTHLKGRSEFQRETADGMIGEARMKVKTAETSLSFKSLAMMAAVANIKKFEDEIIGKIDLFEERLPRFRSEIEHFFDE